MGQHPNVRKVQLEAEAVLNLKSQLSSLGLLGNGEQEDAQTIALAIESETNLLELFEKLLDEEREADADVAKMDKRIKELQERKKSYTNRKNSIRALILQAMLVSEQDTLRTAFGTLSVRTLAGKLIVENPAEIDSDYYVQPPAPPPELDEKKLLADIKARNAERAPLLKEIEQIDDPDEKLAAMTALNERLPPIAGASIGDETKSLTIRV